eukprot:Rhum_TRINITY_DN23462_c0_g1::Rhum_TRINITY_DN23462_c0_g1_i1::g.178056::m.178056
MFVVNAVVHGCTRCSALVLLLRPNVEEGADVVGGVLEEGAGVGVLVGRVGDGLVHLLVRIADCLNRPRVHILLDRRRLNAFAQRQRRRSQRVHVLVERLHRVLHRVRRRGREGGQRLRAAVRRLVRNLAHDLGEAAAAHQLLRLQRHKLCDLAGYLLLKPPRLVAGEGLLGEGREREMQAVHEQRRMRRGVQVAHALHNRQQRVDDAAEDGGELALPVLRGRQRVCERVHHQPQLAQRLVDDGRRREVGAGVARRREDLVAHLLQHVEEVLQRCQLQLRQQLRQRRVLPKQTRHHAAVELQDALQLEEGDQAVLLILHGCRLQRRLHLHPDGPHGALEHGVQQVRLAHLEDGPRRGQQRRRLRGRRGGAPRRRLCRGRGGGGGRRCRGGCEEVVEQVCLLRHALVHPREHVADEVEGVGGAADAASGGLLLREHEKELADDGRAADLCKVAHARAPERTPVLQSVQGADVERGNVRCVGGHDRLRLLVHPPIQPLVALRLLQVRHLHHLHAGLLVLRVEKVGAVAVDVLDLFEHRKELRRNVPVQHGLVLRREVEACQERLDLLLLRLGFVQLPVQHGEVVRHLHGVGARLLQRRRHLRAALREARHVARHTLELLGHQPELVQKLRVEPQRARVEGAAEALLLHDIGVGELALLRAVVGHHVHVADGLQARAHRVVHRDVQHLLQLPRQRARLRRRGAADAAGAAQAGRRRRRRVGAAQVRHRVSSPVCHAVNEVQIL